MIPSIFELTHTKYLTLHSLCSWKIRVPETLCELSGKKKKKDKKEKKKNEKEKKEKKEKKRKKTMMMMVMMVVITMMKGRTWTQINEVFR